MRDRSIDVGRGVLVILMVYCHVLQFFADPDMFPLAGRLIDAINVTVFPTFVFYFGATGVLAYLSKPYLCALPGMVRTSLRAYIVFVLSGVGYRVLCENKPFGPGTVRRVMQAADIPGWSEFLIAFAAYGLLMIAGFAALRWLSQRPLASLIVGALCVLSAAVTPYGSVTIPQLAVFVGGTGFACFPVMQYMPYFLAGMIYARGGRGIALLALSMLSTAAGIGYAVTAGGLPGRFPPTWGWILISALCTALVVLAGKGLCMLSGGGIRRIADGLCSALAHLGSRSLYYLLASNLVIFTMAGKGIVPSLSRKSVLPWTTPIQSPQGAACWTAVLLLALCFAARLAGRGGARKAS